MTARHDKTAWSWLDACILVVRQRHHEESLSSVCLCFLVQMDLDRQAYLRAVAPTYEAYAGDGGVYDAASGAGISGSTGGLGPGHVLSAAHGDAVMLAALNAALKPLFMKHGVCTMANVRQWLLEYPDAGPARQVAYNSDRSLDECILSCGSDYVSIRRMYVLRTTGQAGLDPFRMLVVDTLRHKESFKKVRHRVCSAFSGSSNGTLIQMFAAFINLDIRLIKCSSPLTPSLSYSCHHHHHHHHACHAHHQPSISCNSCPSCAPAGPHCYFMVRRQSCWSWPRLLASRSTTRSTTRCGFYRPS